MHSTAEEHMDDLMDLFKVLRKYSLKLSPHNCQFFEKKIVYMGLEFQIQGDKVCYTPLKDKCDAIRNLESPKTLRQTRAFCGMVNFLSSFLAQLISCAITNHYLWHDCHCWRQHRHQWHRHCRQKLTSSSVPI